MEEGTNFQRESNNLPTDTNLAYSAGGNLQSEKPKKLIFIIAVLVILGIGGTVGALYTQIWNPTWNPFRPAPPPPKVVLAEMALKMRGAKTFHVDVKYFGEGSSKRKYIEESILSEKQEQSLDLSLDFNKSNIENKKSKGTINVRTYNESNVSGKEPHSNEFKVGLEFIGINEALYLRPTEVPGEYLGMIEYQFGKIKDQWIEINKHTIEEILKTWGPGTDLKQISPEKEEKFIEELYGLLKNRELFEVKSQLPDEEIRGKMTYHYLLTLNRKEIKGIAPEAIEIIKKYLPEYIPEESVWEIESMIDNYSYYLEGDFYEGLGISNNTEIEIWIGQEDKYLYKVRIQEKKDLEDFRESMEEMSEKYELDLSEMMEDYLELESTMSLEIDFSEFNEPVEIRPPEEFKTIEDFFSYMEDPIGYGRDTHILTEATSEVFLTVETPNRINSESLYKDDGEVQKLIFNNVSPEEKEYKLPEVAACLYDTNTKEMGFFSTAYRYENGDFVEDIDAWHRNVITIPPESKMTIYLKEFISDIGECSPLELKNKYEKLLLVPLEKKLEWSEEQTYCQDLSQGEIQEATKVDIIKNYSLPIECNEPIYLNILELDTILVILSIEDGSIHASGEMIFEGLKIVDVDRTDEIESNDKVEYTDYRLTFDLNTEVWTDHHDSFIITTEGMRTQSGKIKVNFFPDSQTVRLKTLGVPGELYHSIEDNEWRYSQ